MEDCFWPKPEQMKMLLENLGQLQKEPSKGKLNNNKLVGDK